MSRTGARTADGAHRRRSAPGRRPAPRPPQALRVWSLRRGSSGVLSHSTRRRKRRSLRGPSSGTFRSTAARGRSCAMRRAAWWPIRLRHGQRGEGRRSSASAGSARARGGRSESSALIRMTPRLRRDAELPARRDGHDGSQPGQNRQPDRYASICWRSIRTERSASSQRPASRRARLAASIAMHG